MLIFFFFRTNLLHARRYHRILDLETFRSFLREGFLTVDGFVSVVSADWEQRLLPALETAEDINDFFFMCRDYKAGKLAQICFSLCLKSNVGFDCFLA